MPDKELIKVSIEEFSRLQNYIKVILTSFGINLTDIDKIKE